MQYTSYSKCSNTCGAGIVRRSVTCRDAFGEPELPGTDPKCAHCDAKLQKPCYTSCDSCASNKGKGPCVYGTCAAASDGSAKCSCDKGYEGACSICWLVEVFSVGCTWHVCAPHIRCTCRVAVRERL